MAEYGLGRGDALRASRQGLCRVLFDDAVVSSDAAALHPPKLKVPPLI